MKNNYNAVYDNNGKLVDINVSLPQGFPADLSEISGFDISKNETSFLRFENESGMFLVTVSPFLDKDEKKYSVSVTLFREMISNLATDADTVVTNTLAICRTSMQNITGLASNLLDVLDKAELYEDKALVLSQIKNCYRMLRSIQNIDEAYSYINNSFNPVSFKPADIIEPIFKTVKIISTGSYKSITLDIPDKDVNIFADPKRFENAFLNLLSNALLYSPDEAHIAISVKKIGEKIAVVVSDDGYGMNADEIAKATEPGFTSGAKLGKQGLGLFLAKRFTDSCKGGIIISSKENEGTSVTMTFRESKTDAISLESKAVNYYSRLFSPVEVALCESFDCNLLSLM